MTGYTALGRDGSGLAGGERRRGYKRMTQILRAPPELRDQPATQPRFRRPSSPSLGSIAQPSKASANDRKKDLTRRKGNKRKRHADKATGWCLRREDRCEPSSGQVATYLLHLVQRRLVHAELLEVILRGLDHLVDDLLVDSALAIAISMAACAFTPLARAPGAY